MLINLQRYTFFPNLQRSLYVSLPPRQTFSVFTPVSPHSSVIVKVFSHQSKKSRNFALYL